MDIGIVALFGMVIGSFLNVIIDRMPKGESIVWKPSHCDHCKKPLRWFELFPVMSFIAFRGACLRCKKRLSWQYPLVECMTACGFLYIYSTWSSLEMGIASLIIFCVYVVLFGIDYKHQILPDELLVVLLGVILVLGLGVGPSDWRIHGIAGVSAGGFFLLIWLLTKGRGLGFGDVKLSLVLGFLLGYPSTIIALYVAFLTGAIVGVILIVSQKAGMKSRIAFGPFLIIGAVSAYIWGDGIWQVWQRLLLL